LTVDGITGPAYWSFPASRLTPPRLCLSGFMMSPVAALFGAVCVLVTGGAIAHEMAQEMAQHPAFDIEAHRGGRGAIWSPYFGDVTAALVAEAHALGLRVVVWTVNKPDDIAAMIGLGVDGIISDRPDLLRQIAGEKGIALPAATPVAP
jgi:hypothetical protein